MSLLLQKPGCLAWVLGLAMIVDGLPLSMAIADEAGRLTQPIRVVRDVVYSHVAGIDLLADIYRPDDERLRPAVLMIHGGAWTAGDKWNYQLHARQLALAGYVAVPINYRLAPKYTYPAQLEDARSALKWLAENADRWKIDRRYLAVYGYSAGAQLAALLATNPQPDTPKLSAAVCGGTPCDFTFLPENNRLLAHVMGGSRAEKPDIYRNASPINFVTADDCPILFFHGTTDLLVPKKSSRALYDALRSVGVDTEYFTVEGQGHLVAFIHSAAREAAIEFLGKYLKLEH